ncbi:hypothetical protein Tco_0868302 [Tanacetum coccineum]
MHACHKFKMYHHRINFLFDPNSLKTTAGVEKKKEEVGSVSLNEPMLRPDAPTSGSSWNRSRILLKTACSREREVKSEESERVIRATSVEVDDDGVINGRKKLRFTKAQSALLEQAFKHHSILNLVCILYLSHAHILSGYLVYADSDGDSSSEERSPRG